MKQKLTKIGIILAFIAGLSLLTYPLLANEWNSRRQERLMSSYEETVKGLEAESGVDYTAEWQKAWAYNAALLPRILPDSFAQAAAQEEGDDEYRSLLNLAGDGTMGIVEIPKINVRLPIYHGTSPEALEKGAGHLIGSSLPVGGENTHSVISAHRGLPSASLFTDLDKLEEGDHFLLHILDDTLCYEVDRINVVEPEETELLQIEDGADLVTLLTCTPYGVNSHRLLVRGHRVPYTEEILAEKGDNVLGAVSLHTNYLFWVVLGLAVTALLILILLFYDRNVRKRRRGTSGDTDRKNASSRAEEIVIEDIGDDDGTEAAEEDNGEITGDSTEREEITEADAEGKKTAKDSAEGEEITEADAENKETAEDVAESEEITEAGGDIRESGGTAKDSAESEEITEAEKKENGKSETDGEEAPCGTGWADDVETGADSWADEEISGENWTDEELGKTGRENEKIAGDDAGDGKTAGIQKSVKKNGAWRRK